MAERKIGSRAAPAPLLMLGAVICFGVMAVFVKLLRERGMSTETVVLWRMAPGVPVVAALLVWRRERLWPRRPVWVACRVVFGGAAMGSYFWALESLSLFANAALALTQPAFVALISPAVLKERATRGVWLALGGSIAGASLVVGNRADAALAFGVFGLPALVRLLSSLSSAFAHSFIRKATVSGPAHELADAPNTVVLHFMLWVSLVALALGLATNGGGHEHLALALTPQGNTPYLVGMATAGLLGQLMLSRAYASGRAPIVALMGYAAVPLSLVFDATIWEQEINGLQLLGAAVTVTAGVWLLRHRAR